MPERLVDGEVRRVKESIDLVDLMGDYTQVQKVGSAFKACCPFHQERTPSLYIYQEDQHFHCYGCGEHGDAISLVRDLEQMEFIEAIEHLARRAGIALRYEQVRSRDGQQAPRIQRGERERMLAAMEWATQQYEGWLWRSEEGGEARDYLGQRGLDEATCRDYRLGWAPGGSSLVAAALRRRADVRMLEQVNLAMERNGRHIDRFYERLMFPICNRQGQPVAFSGRLLPAAERAAKEAGRGVGKYINSTDTPLYHKGSVVFNLHRARKHVREQRRLVVMEGPTDVMAAEQAGYPACVAVLGTALTDEHARQLGRQVGADGKLVLLFDGDSAGQTNSIKAVRTCLGAGMASHVAIMPEGQDPADLLSSEGGLEHFRTTVDNALPDMRHLLLASAGNPGSLQPRERLAAADRLLEPLRGIADGDLRMLYLQEISEHLGLEVPTLAARLAAGAVAEMPRGERDMGLVEGMDGPTDALMHILVRRVDLRGLLFDDHEIEPAMVPRPWRTVLEVLIEDPERLGRDLIDVEAIAVDETLRGAVFGWLRSDHLRTGDTLEMATEVLPDLLPRVVAAGIDREISQLETELRHAEDRGDLEAAGILFPQIQDLRHQRNPMVDGDT